MGRVASLSQDRLPASSSLPEHYAGGIPPTRPRSLQTGHRPVWPVVPEATGFVKPRGLGFGLQLLMVPHEEFHCHKEGQRKF